MSSAIVRPEYGVQIMFSPGDWTPIAGLRRFHTKRGRQRELGTIEPGEATIVLDNAAGLLSPNYTAFYGSGPRLMRPVRIIAEWASTDYTLFTGYAESWLPRDNGPVDADMVITCKDFFKQLSLAKLYQSFDRQGPATRIAAVLDAVGTTGIARSLDPDIDEALAADLAGVSALNHINDVLAGERGVFFVAGNGTLTYHNRHHRAINSSGYTSQLTLGQPTSGSGYPVGVRPYKRLEPSLDDRDIYNDIVVNATGAGEVGAAFDADSADPETGYWPRTLAISAPWLQEGKAQSLAEWLLYVYKDPLMRVPSVLLDPDGDPTNLYPHLLGREIGDRITVRKANPGRVDLDRDMWIEGVEHDFDAQVGAQTTTWQLSDAASQGPEPFRLSLSALNSGHKLVY